MSAINSLVFNCACRSNNIDIFRPTKTDSSEKRFMNKSKNVITSLNMFLLLLDYFVVNQKCNVQVRYIMRVETKVIDMCSTD